MISSTPSRIGSASTSSVSCVGPFERAPRPAEDGLEDQLQSLGRVGRKDFAHELALELASRPAEALQRRPVGGHKAHVAVEEHDRQVGQVADQPGVAERPNDLSRSGAPGRRGALGQGGAELVRRHRPGVEVALTQVAAEAAQQLSLAGRLYSFGDDPLVESVGHGDDPADQGKVLRVGFHALNEGTGDLEVSHGEAAQMGQRGVSGAEVVERDPDPELPQPSQLARGGVDVADHRRLGDLQRQPLCGQAALGERRAHILYQARVQELAR